MELIHHDEVMAITNEHLHIYSKFLELVEAKDNYNKFITEYQSQQTKIKSSKARPDAPYWEKTYSSYFESKFNDIEIHKKINQQFISRLLRMDKLSKVLTNEARAKLYQDIENIATNKDFIICEATAHDILSSFFGGADGIIKETLIKCYRKLTHNYGEFKTVDKWRVGKKVILKYYSIYDLVNTLCDLETVLNLVTGNLQTSRKEWDKLDSTIDVAEGIYFKVKKYQNGNVHILFSDLDAIEKFNCKIGSMFNWIKK